MRHKYFLHSVNNIWCKIVKFGWFIPISHIFLLFFGRYIPKNISMRLQNRRNRLICKWLRNHFDFKSAIRSDSSPGAVDFKAPIWFCWLQGEEHLSDISALCLNSIRKNAGDHPVIVLTLDNFANYVKIYPYIIRLYEEHKLKPAHFADILRINLLAQRGGLWLDATLLLAKQIDESFFTNEFDTIKIEPFGNYISQCRWSVFCLGCQPDNVLFKELSRLFNEYLSRYTEFIDYFLFDHFINLLYVDNKCIREMIDRVPMNNPRVHSLSSLMCEDFNDRVYEELLSDTQIFKLSSRKYTHEQLYANSRSFFVRLKQIYKVD